MSDDLTERLRDRRVCSPAQNSCRNDYICDLAAARIEELEAKLAKAVGALRVWIDFANVEGMPVSLSDLEAAELTGGKDAESNL